MEQNGSNQNMPSTSLCIRGCGFYGNSALDGMCSKCHKDTVKRRQHNPTPTGLLSPAPSSLAPVEVKESASSCTMKTSSSLSIGSTASSVSIETNTTPSVETGSPTVQSIGATAKSTESNESLLNTSTDVATTSGTESPADKDKKPKKNRCHTCKKKVGLTGFQCRCGGLYCGLHRYSDKHECTFDYKELAQEEIRKANPVVVGSKVQKI